MSVSVSVSVYTVYSIRLLRIYFLLFCALIHSFIGLFDECLGWKRGNGMGMGFFPSNHPSSFAVSLIFQLMKLFKGHINFCTNETKPIPPPNISTVLNRATTRCNTHYTSSHAHHTKVS